MKILTKNEMARIDFIEEVRSAINELETEFSIICVEVAKCYRDPPLIKGVIGATTYLDRLLNDETISHVMDKKWFFATCEALGIRPDSFGFTGKTAKIIEEYMLKKKEKGNA